MRVRTVISQKRSFLCRALEVRRLSETTFSSEVVLQQKTNFKLMELKFPLSTIFKHRVQVAVRKEF